MTPGRQRRARSLGSGLPPLPQEFPGGGTHSSEIVLRPSGGFLLELRARWRTCTTYLNGQLVRTSGELRTLTLLLFWMNEQMVHVPQKLNFIARDVAYNNQHAAVCSIATRISRPKMPHILQIIPTRTCQQRSRRDHPGGGGNTSFLLRGRPEGK